jgi:hypothetical protein
VARILALVLLTVILAACVPGGPSIPPASVLPTPAPATSVAPKSASPTPTPVPRLLATAAAATVTPAISGKDQALQPVLVIRRTGGLAGVEEEWSIYEDGRVTLPNGRRQQVEAEVVSRLLTQITESGFFGLGGAAGGLSKCRDCFNYQITVSKDGQTKTIQVQPESSDIPKELLKAIESIDAFLNALPKG